MDRFSNQATATGTPPSGSDVSDTSDNDSYVGSDPTVTPICTEASIALIKTSDVVLDPTNNCYDVGVGGTITYAFSVKNTGNVTLTGVTVADLNPAVTVVGGPISLAPGAEDTTSFTASYTVTQADIDNGSFSNQATATGTPPSGSDVSDTSDNDSYVGSDPTVTPICTEASIALIKTSDVVLDPTNNCYDVGVGGTITYAFSVKNTGNVTLTGVTVADLNPAVTVVGGPISLAPGAEDTTSFTASYTVTQADIDNGSFSNQATATGTPPSGSDVSDTSDNDSYVGSDPTVTPICTEASIALIKTSDVVLDPTNNCYDVGVGGTITYAFSVKNTGNVTLTGVTVADLNPAVTVVGGPISLAPGAEDTTSFTASYTVTQADIDNGSFSNQATATGTPPSGSDVSDTSDNDSYVGSDPTVTPICTEASIALIKTSDVVLDPTNNCYDVGVGGTITYAFSVKNTGNVTLTGVTVADLNPAVTVVGGPISLAPGAEDTTSFTASYVITQADIDNGSFSNQATATGTPPIGPNVTDLSDDNSYLEDDPTVTTICQNLNNAIALIKVGTYDGFDPAGNCISAPGDVITYAFSVKNQSNVTLTNVVVTDPLVTMVGLPITLAPGAEDTTSFTASYVITQADIDNGSFSNQATATGTPPIGPNVTDLSDDNSYLEDDPTVTTICQNLNNAIALIKVGTYDGFDPAGNCISAPGDVITYAFSVKNQSNVTLTNVVVTDPLVTMVGLPITLAPGAEDTTSFTASYVITQADIDNGSFSNQATATGTPPIGPNVTDLSDDNSYLEDDPTVTTICQNLNNAIALIKVGTYDGFDPAGNCISAPGDVITYAFSVKNQSNVTLTNVVVTDPLVTMVGLPITLAPGAEDTTSFTASYVITQADIDNGSFSNQATATGTPPIGPNVTDLSDDNSYLEDDPTVTTICQNLNNAIALIKVGTYDGFDPAGNCISAPGDVITYAFSVKNQSNVTLTNVVVTDPLVTMVGLPITLAPGAEDTTSFTASYVITQADIDNGSFSNQATATGTPPIGPNVTDLSDDNSYLEDDPTVTTICQNLNNAIALIKVGTYDGFDPAGNCISAPGDVITYAFSVKNQSNVTLTNVVVTDPLVTMVGLPITLAPGAEDTTSFTASYVITQADIDNGSFSNQATATGTPPIGPNVTDLSDDNSYLEDDPTVTTICQNLNNAIALIKVGTYDGFDPAGNCISAPGDVITYAFSVKNQSNVTLTNVVVTDPLVTMVGLPITLAPGAEDTTSFTASYVITQADIDNGSFSNQATATGTPPIGPNVTDLSDDNSYLEDDPTVTTICQNLNNAIALIKVGTYDGFDPAGNCISAPGDVITYAFSVKNQSNVTLTNVVVTDPLVTMVGLPITLAPGAEDTTSFTASYVITQADIDNGSFSNQATATGTPPIGPNVTDLSDDNSYLEDDPTVTTICQNLNNAIALIKVGTYDGFDPAGNCISAPGDVITYAFSVKNQSNVTLTNVVVTDPLVTMVGLPITLAPGAEDTTSFTASYVITQADIDNGSFSNQATATGTPPIGPNVTDLSDDNSYLEDDPTVTTICQNLNNAIALIKVGTYDGFDPAGNCISAPGDVITYAFSVKNQSNVTLTNVVVTDPLVTMVGLPITLAPGAEDTTSFTASYVITQADIDNGSFSNQATATGTPPIGPNVTDLSDDNSYLEDDPTVTTICQNLNNAIALIKVGTYDGFDPAGNCISAPGDVITYAFSVKNQSNVTLTNVVVTDPLVTMVGLPITLAPGAEDTTSFTASYVITQADIDNGSFSNQATATGTPPIGPNVTDLSDDNSYLEDDPTVTTICQSQQCYRLIKVGTYDGSILAELYSGSGRTDQLYLHGEPTQAMYRLRTLLW